MKMLFILSISVWISCFSIRCSCFNLTILHTNDIHAHIEQTNANGGPCAEEDEAEDKCYGGFPRLITKVMELRSRRPQNTILLDAGDQFQGTTCIWFYYFKWNVTAMLVNKLDYDAMALGNHEFDLFPAGLKSYLEHVTPPVVSANTETSKVPELSRFINSSITLSVGGRKVGVIGYTTPETTQISNPGNVEFSPIIPALKREVGKLVSEGVNKIIAVGHAGYSVDRKIAQEVEGVDVVVGGHSHTLLYTGVKAPLNEEILGPYPTVVKQSSGAQVLVVQASSYNKYLGYLEVEFDDEGKVTAWQGNPILLDKTIPRDESTLRLMQPWEASLTNITHETIGSSAVFLEGNRDVCRYVECNLGNAIADGMVHAYLSLSGDSGQQWTTAPIALMNGGGIRTPLEKGDITSVAIVSVLPFRNTIDRIHLKGTYLRQALEHSVAMYPKDKGDDPPGGFLQFSGVQVVYNLQKAPGSRVVSVQVRCSNCTIPKFEPLDEEKLYTLVLPNFIANGGDGYTVIRDNLIRLPRTDMLDAVSFTNYVRKFSPLTNGLEGRILFATDDKKCAVNTGAAHTTVAAVVVTIFILVSGQR